MGFVSLLEDCRDRLDASTHELGIIQRTIDASPNASDAHRESIRQRAAIEGMLRKLTKEVRDSSDVIDQLLKYLSCPDGEEAERAARTRLDNEQLRREMEQLAEQRDRLASQNSTLDASVRSLQEQLYELEEQRDAWKRIADSRSPAIEQDNGALQSSIDKIERENASLKRKLAAANRKVDDARNSATKHAERRKIEARDAKKEREKAVREALRNARKKR